MLGNELDKKIKTSGVVLLELESSFPYESIVRSFKGKVLFLDGPISLGKKLYEKICSKSLRDLILSEPEDLIIASITSLYYREILLEGLPGKSKESKISNRLAALRDKYYGSEKTLAAIAHFDAMNERFVLYLETLSDYALRMHPMGKKAVAIVRRAPNAALIGETYEFSVMRDAGSNREGSLR